MAWQFLNLGNFLLKVVKEAMTVHHLSCGTLCPIGALMINGSGGVLEAGKLVCHCLLIETPEGLVLVDTGLGVRDMEDPSGRLGKLPSSIFRIEQDTTRTALQQIRALGFHAHEVRHIVVTHLDFDHAGGLADFPWAKVHVLDIEHAVAVHPQSLIERNRYCQAQFLHSPEWVLHSFSRGEKWFGFEKVRPLPSVDPEVLLIPLHGHTRGHCGVAVRQKEGWLLHCGDAIFHHNELDPVEPDAPIGLKLIQHMMKDDIEAVEANQALLRQLYHENRESIRFICSHDPSMFEGIPVVPESQAYLG